MSITVDDNNKVEHVFTSSLEPCAYFVTLDGCVMLGMECAGEASAAVGHHGCLHCENLPSTSFPREAKDFVSLGIRFLFLLYHLVKTPLHANTVLVWGSQSSTVPDLGILKRTEFSSSVHSQNHFLKDSRCRLLSCVSCSVSCLPCVRPEHGVAGNADLTFGIFACGHFS